MRRLALSALLMLASSLALPAGAQIAGRHPPSNEPRRNPLIIDGPRSGPGIGRDVRDIKKRIDQKRDAGILTRREARRLKREARHIGASAHVYGHDGMSASERMELEARAAYLRDAVNRPSAPPTGGKRKR